MKLDVLVMAAHPDDAELGCGGTIALQVSLGYSVGIVDFTRGELGTRGTPELREKEAKAASAILGVAVRENLNLSDGFFQNLPEHQREVIKVVRNYRPEIVLANAITDRHVDHGKGSNLAYDACFLAGLSKIETTYNGQAQAPWRPKAVYHYIQSQYIVPDFVVDITAHWDTKMAAIKAFRSQFYDPSSNEPETYISSPSFLKMIEARAVEFGHAIGAGYGEGFTVRRYAGVKNLFDLR
jgi:bacillithiol biosynthesis deacetylase BshB1